ncbi:unnamed protein product [Leptosia nina]|uniref:Uncharacterized protein n=1 Tax=Leptosia nina TaxID=320188 RepID=A0AAV1ISV6_9NEOP
MVTCFTKSAQKWGLANEKVGNFYLSSWQHGDSPMPMLVVRAIMAFIASLPFVGSIVADPTHHWLTYLTHWGITLVFCMTISALSVSVVATRRKLPDDCDGNLPWYVSLYWLMYNVALTAAMSITFLYWNFLYVPKNDGNVNMFLLDLATHCFNACIVFTEFIACRTPLRLHHIYQPMTAAFCYASFTGIYYAAGGVDRFGEPFIYKTLDWRHPAETLPKVAGSLTVPCIFFMLMCGLTRLRDKISITLRPKSLRVNAFVI